MLRGRGGDARPLVGRPVWPAVTVHVEMAPHWTFCLQRPEALPSEDYTVQAKDWIPDIENVQHSNCPACLHRLFMLGDSAAIALAKLGLKVEVANVPSEAVLS